MAATRMFDIAILDKDTKMREALHDALKAFKAHPTVEGVAIRLTPCVDSIAKLKAIFERGSANALMLDIYAFGGREGIGLYQWVRDNYPMVPICRYAIGVDLERQPGILKDWVDRRGDGWADRLGHVYSIEKHLKSDDLAKAIERELTHFRDWVDAHEGGPNPAVDTTVPAIRLRSEVEGRESARTNDVPKLSAVDLPKETPPSPESQERPYFVAQKSPFKPMTAAEVARLREQPADFEVFVDDEMAELFIDGKPIVYPGPQVIGLLRLLLEKGTGEILDKDVAKVLGYEVAKDKPIRQLYGDLKKAIQPKLDGNVVARRGLGKRVFKQTFTFCFIEKRS